MLAHHRHTDCRGPKAQTTARATSTSRPFRRSAPYHGASRLIIDSTTTRTKDACQHLNKPLAGRETPIHNQNDKAAQIERRKRGEHRHGRRAGANAQAIPRRFGTDGEIGAGKHVRLFGQDHLARSLGIGKVGCLCLTCQATSSPAQVMPPTPVRQE